MTDDSDKRGGAREGAGRSPEYDERMIHMKAVIPPHFAEKIKEFGFGNQSLGVRRLVADAFDLDLSQEDVRKVEDNLMNRNR